MKFPYESVVLLSADSGEPEVIGRPMIPVRIHGGSRNVEWLGLADTGADVTIIPKGILDALDISVEAGRGPQATAFGGQALPLSFADVEFELAHGDQTLRWSLRVQVFEFANPDEETLILGHVGFFEFFTAIFDGDEWTLELKPNQWLAQ